MKKQNKSQTEHIVAVVESGSPVSYTVPGEVAVALNTGRSQFINGLVKRVRAGHVIEQIQVVGMLELIRDWTDAKYADDRRNVIVKENLAASMAGMLELRAQVGELVGRLNNTVASASRVAARHGCGQPIGPEDEAE